MSKKKSRLAPQSSVVQNQKMEIDPKVQEMIRNGLEGAIMGFNPGGTGGAISSTQTIFHSLRNYFISNMRQPLSQAYCELGLIQTVVDVPVDDGLRGGVTFKSKQMSPEELEQLHVYMESEDILNSVIGQSLKWNRLFGGAAIIVMTDQDPLEPFEIDLVDEKTPLEFRPVDMWELYYNRQNVDGFNPAILSPEFDFYDYYGLQLHKSFVMKLKGVEAPSFVRPRLRGWGLSIVEFIVRSVNQYLKSNGVAFELLDEAKIDFYKIKGLAMALGTVGGQERTTSRIALANWQKNYQHAVTMDAEDNWEQKVLQFSGLADVMKEIRLQVASDLRMPLTKIFGMSATGLNAGQDDIENYNSMVESTVRAKSKYDTIRIAKIICQKLFGYVPEDLQVEYKPLRVLSGVDEETVKTQKLDRMLRTAQAGLMTAKEFKDGCNKANLLEVQIDTSIEQIVVEGDEPEDSQPAEKD